jgi:hypothetical protein
MVLAKNTQRNHTTALHDHEPVHPELVPDKGAPEGANSTSHVPNSSYTSKIYHSFQPSNTCTTDGLGAGNMALVFYHLTYNQRLP